MKEKLLTRAALGKAVKRPPVWMMRQAGRYLPEYHATKEKAGGFMGLCKIPEHAIEVTLQPIRRFGFDAAILFSDILIPAEAMGIALTYNPGPVIGNPVRTRQDVDALVIPETEGSLSFVTEIIKGLRSALPEETALIGFAGAPFTVASYLVAEAGGKGGTEAAKGAKGGTEAVRRMAYEAPAVLQGLITKITKTTTRYLDQQISAGAELVQLFDSSAWLLPRHLYETLALEPARQVIASLAGRSVPTIYFAPGAMSQLERMTATGADVIGVDWRVGLDDARRILGPDIAVQGNLDPACLLGDRAQVAGEVARVLEQNRGRPGHIFNLGHGVLPDTPQENVAAMVAAVKAGG
jgi:uroporphyrinogen decarboxylase